MEQPHDVSDIMYYISPGTSRSDIGTWCFFSEPSTSQAGAWKLFLRDWANDDELNTRKAWQRHNPKLKARRFRVTIGPVE